MPNSAVRLLIFGLAAVGLTTVFSACGGGQPTTVSQQIVALDGGTVSLGEDITLRIPAGALAEDTTVIITTATEENPSPDELEAAQSVGPALNIDLGGQELSKPVTIEIAFDPDLLSEDTPEDVVFLAFYDEEAGDWVPVGGQVDQERNVVIIETDHLSWWNPFTWNWDAWIAVLKKTLSLSISDYIEGIVLLTEKCDESGENVTADNTTANSVIKGCVTKSDPSNPQLRVVNLKSFHVGLSPAVDGPGYPKATILGPGEAARFTASTTDKPPAIVYANFTEESMRWVLASVVLRFLPLGKTVPAEGIGHLANAVGQESEIASLLVDIQRDPLKAAEKFITLIKKDAFIKAFSNAATEFGRTHKGFEFMTKWGEAGIRKVLIAVAAVDVIITVTDFVANYFANNRSEVAFSWAVAPTDCPVEDPGFCTFAGEVATAATAGDVDWFVDHVMLAKCPIPGGVVEEAGEQVQICEADLCLWVGLLGGEATCRAMPTLEADMSESLSGGLRLFGIVYPEVGLFERNSIPSDDGPALLLGGSEIGKMLVAHRSGGEWMIASVVNMHPSTLYFYSPDIDYWLDTSEVGRMWLDAVLHQFLLGLPESTEEYRIEDKGFPDGQATIEITLYAILNRASQLCSWVQQLEEYGRHALEWILSQGVEPEALIITWRPSEPSEEADAFPHCL